MQNRGVQVMHVDLAVDSEVANCIRLTEVESGLDSPLNGLSLHF